ncbi:MAG: T9SS type A sorting domain-containing protein [Bacteroidetes bacterium]|nr:T9SS type A sorting domain-containing protein [Bacteroidota bacterium]
MPNNGYFTLGFNAQKEVGILEIIDAMGRMVYGEKVAQWSQYKKVDITSIPMGIYFVGSSGKLKLQWLRF